MSIPFSRHPIHPSSFQLCHTHTYIYTHTHAHQANYSALHSVPLYMNQINTAILRLVTGNDQLSISVTMHPFPRELFYSPFLPLSEKG